jgi:NADH-quinone oxidoreductase subunit L
VTPESLFRFAPLAIALPVAGLLLNLAFGRRLGERFAGTVGCAAVVLAFVVSLLQAVALGGAPQGVILPIADWIDIGRLHVAWALQIDTLAVTMMLVVTGVGSLIHIYATAYMHDDVRFNGDPRRYTRFFVYFNLFIASMLILVTGDSFLTLFVGWEGVGLCSYLLIGFWYEKGADGIGNAWAGKKAFVTNRVGDAGFLIGLFLIFTTFGTLNFHEVFAQAEAGGAALTGVLTVITLCLLIGATGKSAQIPLYVWLPDAMAGPTPVSALIHAATMVTAGIYMIVRSNVLFSLAPATSSAVAWIGALTALFAATIAVGQYDIKRVLAYSTISQLGFMVAAAGLGAYTAAIFHLVGHAFFKALLFLGAGSVILGIEHAHHRASHPEGDPGGDRASHPGGNRATSSLRATEGHPGGGHAGQGELHGSPFDPQDMRNMGGMWRRMPVTHIVYVIGALALAGLPPLVGFFSKDEILVDAFIVNKPIYVLLVATALLTAFYTGRQLFLVFYGAPRSEPAAHAQESPPLITVPLMALAALSVLGGFLNLPAGLPASEQLFHWMTQTIQHLHVVEPSLFVAGLASGFTLVGLGTAWLVYGRSPLAAGAADPLRRLLGPVFVGMEHKWWVDELYDRLLLRPYVRLSRFLAETVDQRWWHDDFHERVILAGYNRLSHWLAWSFDLPVIDGAANALGRATQSGAGGLRRLQSGFVRTYALSILIGAVLMLTYILLR